MMFRDRFKEFLQGHSRSGSDRRGKRRTFPLGPGFLLEGRPVVLSAPVTRPAPAPPRRTASGSVAVTGQRARVARESRIFVEGWHDAELVEKVWGDDLRVEGVVVEHLGGVDDLLGALDDLDWPERVKTMQRNWIGRSPGLRLNFSLKDDPRTVEIFTTRPDTLFGATFFVLAPEHPLATELTVGTEHEDQVVSYIRSTAARNWARAGAFIGPAVRRHRSASPRSTGLTGTGTGAAGSSGMIRR